MPAAPSSPIAPEIGHLFALTETVAGDRAGLLSVLAQVPDPRRPRGSGTGWRPCWGWRCAR